MSLSSEQTDNPQVVHNLDLPDPPPPRPKKTIAELLLTARAADDDMLDHDIDLEALGKEIKDKVDDVVEFMDLCDAHAASNAKRAAQFSAKASAWSNKRARLEEHVAFYMKTTATTAVPGNAFAFRLRESEKTKPLKPADAALYFKLKNLAPQLIKRSYDWKLGPLKKLLKAGDPAVKDLAVVEKGSWLEIITKA